MAWVNLIANVSKKDPDGTDLIINININDNSVKIAGNKIIRYLNILLLELTIYLDINKIIGNTNKIIELVLVFGTKYKNKALNIKMIVDLRYLSFKYRYHIPKRIAK